MSFPTLLREKSLLLRLQDIKNMSTPIFIFQMGKVGSRSLLNTISSRYNGTVVHAHNFDLLSPEEQLILKWRRSLHLPMFVISPIRDPFSRNISAFFENFKRDTGYNISDKKWTVSQLRKLFLNYFRHNSCTEWFDRYMLTTFGIDVFSCPFPVEKKWNIYHKGATKLLVYRTDLAHKEQLQILSQFLDCDLQSWIYGNITSEREYAKLYKKFINSVLLPDNYFNIMCNSRYSEQFWSKDEMDEFCSIYMKKD